MRKHIIHFTVLAICAIVIWVSMGLHGVADRRDVTLNESPVYNHMPYFGVVGNMGVLIVITDTYTFVSEAGKEIGF